MHFTTIAASAAVIGSAMAGDYYTTSSVAPVYTSKVYTSVSTCTKGAEGKPTTSAYYYTTSAAVPYVHSTTSSAAGPYVTPVTYTSYEHITVTSCADYVKSCPASTYTSAHYSTCTEGNAYTTTPMVYATPSAPVYSSVPYYQPPSNNTVPYYHVPTTSAAATTTPAIYATPSSSVHYTTVYTTVCPGANYCYGTTVTTTYCPSTTPAMVYSSAPAPPAVYTTSITPAAPVCPGGSYCPSQNATTPTGYAPPVATGGAATNGVSLGLGAFAALVAFLAL